MVDANALQDAIFNSKIFVVDDNPINLLVMRKLIEKTGYTNVKTSASSETAIADIAEYDPDLVILDLNMPLVTGYDILGDLRSRSKSQGFMPVLVFTADSTGEARSRALELGASDFLTKPGDPTEIRLRIRNFLTMRHYHSQLETQNMLLEARVQERTRSLYDAQLEVVHRLALAGDYRDDDTGDHCRRVGELSGDIALAYGVDPEEAELVRVAAPLHDIGKVGISDLILNKPGPLSVEERAIMREHTKLGGAILANGRSEILQMAHVIALSHHERWDGTGYCAGLAGEDIPLPGRIVAVADVFDALTRNRPYKEAWTADKAKAEIVKASGTQFDPRVVDAFQAVMGLFSKTSAAA